MTTPTANKLRHSGIVQTKRSPLQKGSAPIGAYRATMTENADVIREARHRSEDMRIARELGIDWRAM